MLRTNIFVASMSFVLTCDVDFFFSRVVLAGLNYKLPLLHFIDVFRYGMEIYDDENDEWTGRIT